MPMFFEEIRIKQGLSYISSCPLRILYKSKFIIMATSLGTNAVVVTKVLCIGLIAKILTRRVAVQSCLGLCHLYMP